MQTKKGCYKLIKCHTLTDSLTLKRQHSSKQEIIKQKLGREANYWPRKGARLDASVTDSLKDVQ